MWLLFPFSAFGLRRAWLQILDADLIPLPVLAKKKRVKTMHASLASVGKVTNKMLQRGSNPGPRE